MVENPSDKCFLMCLLLEINVLLLGVHFALIIGGGDVSGSVNAQVKLNPHE